MRRALAEHGVARTLVLGLVVAATRARRGLTSLRERSFDRRYQIDTRGIVRHGERGALNDAVHYQGTSERTFREIIAYLGVAPEELTFVDIGCGKGRALVLAAKLGFHHVVGIEVSTDLAKTARANLRSLGIEADVHTADATEVDFPAEPLLVYLYNPFGEATLRVVVDRLRASLRVRPRVTFVVYVNPVYRQVLVEPYDFAEVGAGHDWIAVRALGPAHIR
jgi:SAM-dependent methyltransferase